MRSTLPAIGALLFSVALLLLGNGLQNTLLPLRASLEAFDPLAIGLLGSSFFLGFSIGGYFGPGMVERVGHIRAFTAMVATASAIVLVHPLAVSPVLWWGLRIGAGACFAILYIVIESWLNERSPNAARGTVFAVYAMISMVMIGFGQALLPLFPVTDYPLFVLSSILISVAAVPVALTRAAAPAPVQKAEIRISRLFRDSPVGVVGCSMVGVSNGAFWALAPVFAKSVASDAVAIATFMSAAIFAGALGQWPLGGLSDRMDRRIVIAGAALLSALAGAALMFAGQISWTGALLAAGAYGFFAFPLYSLCVAHTNDYVEQERFVEIAAGMSLLFGAGSVVGPLLASVLMTQFGEAGLFALTLCAHAALAGFAAWRITRRERAPEEERGAYADAIRAVQTVSQLDLAPPEEEEGMKDGKTEEKTPESAPAS